MLTILALFIGSLTILAMVFLVIVVIGIRHESPTQEFGPSRAPKRM